MSIQDLRGQILLNAGVINESQLKQALEIQETSTKKIGAILVELGFLLEDKMMMTLEKQSGIPWVKLTIADIQEKATRMITSQMAGRYFCCPIRENLGVLTVAVADPVSYEIIDEIRLITNREIELVLVYDAFLMKALEKFYDFSEEDLLEEEEGNEEEDSFDSDEESFIEEKSLEEDFLQEDDEKIFEESPLEKNKDDVCGQERIEKDEKNLYLEDEAERNEDNLYVEKPFETDEDEVMKESFHEKSEQEENPLLHEKNFSAESCVIDPSNIWLSPFWDEILDLVHNVNHIYIRDVEGGIFVQCFKYGEVIVEKLIKLDSSQSIIYQDFLSKQREEGKLSRALFLEIGEKKRKVKFSCFFMPTGKLVHLKCLFAKSGVSTFEDLAVTGSVYKKISTFVEQKKGILYLIGDKYSGISTTLDVFRNHFAGKDKSVIYFGDLINTKLSNVYQFRANIFDEKKVVDFCQEILDINADIFIFDGVFCEGMTKILIDAILSDKLIVVGMNAKNLMSFFITLEQLDISKPSFMSQDPLVVRQKLLRLICLACREVDEEINPSLGEGTFYKSEGCAVCQGKGYEGVKGIFEAFELFDRDKVFSSKNFITEVAEQKNKGVEEDLVFRQEALRMLHEGVTSVKEVQKVGLV